MRRRMMMQKEEEWPADNEIWYTTTDGIALNLGDSYRTVRGDYFVAGYRNPVTTLGNSKFRDLTTLKDVIVPLSVTSVLTAAFYGCSHLESVLGLDNVTYMAIDGAPWTGPFEGLRQGVNLNNGIFPNLTNVGSDKIFVNSKFTTGLSFPLLTGWIPNIFYDTTCDYLELPLVKSMSDHHGGVGWKGVFGYSKIPTIKLQSVETIGSEAFTYSSLQDLYLGSIVPTFSGTIFTNVPNIHIPAASLNDYRNSEQWGKYSNKFITY